MAAVPVQHLWHSVHSAVEASRSSGTCPAAGAIFLMRTSEHFCDAALCSCRPAWLPSDAPATLHVAAQLPASFTAQGQGSSTVLNPEFNWSRFLATSNPSQILQHLQTGDLSRARLADLSPYCRDLGFFTAAVSALSDRHTFEFEVWKWAVLHLQGSALRQLLPMTHLGKRAASYRVVLPGVSLLPPSAADVGLKHLEYWPWVNPYCRPIPRGRAQHTALIPATS
jgi:hypothetical protein